ncbi:MAG TPA: ATP-binding protein [Chloroflexaceae bacterium]|nr:ATP-binding protein [Chloroflexaceae bacterium]
MAPDRIAAEAFLAAMRLAIRRTNVYRGHVISLEPTEHGDIGVRFHRLPGIPRGGIILPAGVLERIERQTVGFARLGERLKAAGRHLKRGLLLYGPPGTGKTLTAMYLAGQMPERTIILLTGQGIGLVEQSCQLARLLQPTTVILEDVDLIAEERTHQNTGTNALLFELLNQMDGLADDADVLFLLTTNRPDILEPALAARPGRIDWRWRCHSLTPSAAAASSTCTPRGWPCTRRSRGPGGPD